MSVDDLRLVTGQTIGEVAALDAEERRRREAAARRAAAEAELARTDATIDRFFNVQPLPGQDVPKSEPVKPDPDREPDLHAGARPSPPSDDTAFEHVYGNLFGRR